MKKYMLCTLLIAVICCGCRKNDNNEEMTMRGKAICDVWFNATKCIMDNMIAPTFKLNAWINADDSMKTVIEERYFKHKQVRPYDETLGIYEIFKGNTLLYSVNTGNRALTDADAEWEIKTYTPYSGNDYYAAMPEFVSIDSFNIITMKYTGANQWMITEQGNNMAGNSIDFQLSLPDTIQTNIYDKEFTLKGCGTYIYTGYDFEDASKESPVSLKFSIDQPLIHNASNKLKWNEGEVTFTASKAGSEDVKVTATYQGDRVIIIYKNVTEAWDNED